MGLPTERRKAASTRSSPAHADRFPGPKFTGWAWAYFGMFVAAPILLVALLLDVVAYAVTALWFDTCYGVLCLF